MSVEEARKNVEETMNSLCFEYGDSHRDEHGHFADQNHLPECHNAEWIDRLILEVQAAMPCYTYDPDNPHSNFTCRERVTHPEDWCQSCKAQEALKEHVPA